MKMKLRKSVLTTVILLGILFTSIYLLSQRNTPPIENVQYALIVDVIGSGTSNPLPGNWIHSEGSTVSVEAFPDSEWTFRRWVLNGSDAGSNNPYTVKMDSNYTLTAVFVEKPPTPVEGVELLSHTGYLDSQGVYHVVGEVQNFEDHPVYFVKVVATFYDSNNSIIDSRFDLTMLDLLLVSRKAPFEVVLLDATQSMKVDHYNLNVTSLATDPIPLGLEILSHTSFEDESGYYIVGEIANIATTRARNVKLIATYYDETEKVVAATFTYLDPESGMYDDLDPGQTEPFEIFLGRERAPYVKFYEVTAESTQYALLT